MRILNFLSLFFILIFYACGGGGGNSHSSAKPVDPSPDPDLSSLGPPNQTLFDNWVCTHTTQIQEVPVAGLSKTSLLKSFETLKDQNLIRSYNRKAVSSDPETCFELMEDWGFNHIVHLVIDNSVSDNECILPQLEQKMPDIRSPDGVYSGGPITTSCSVGSRQVSFIVKGTHDIKGCLIHIEQDYKMTLESNETLSGPSRLYSYVSGTCPEEIHEFMSGCEQFFQYDCHIARLADEEEPVAEIIDESPALFPYIDTPIESIEIINHTENINFDRKGLLLLDKGGNVWFWSKGAGYPKPTQIESLRNISKIRASGYLVIALDTDGDVWTWDSRKTNDGLIKEAQLIDSLNHINDIRIYSDIKIALNEQGQVFKWNSERDPVLMNINGVDKIIHGHYGQKTYFLINNELHELDSHSIRTRRIGEQLFVNGFVNETKAIDDIQSTLFAFINQEGQVYVKGQFLKGESFNNEDDHIIENFIRIHGFENMVSVSIGTSHILGLDHRGQIWAMGINKYGVLGNGRENENFFQVRPILVNSLEDSLITSITASQYSSFAIDEQGRLYSWGQQFINGLLFPETYPKCMNCD